MSDMLNFATQLISINRRARADKAQQDIANREFALREQESELAKMQFAQQQKQFEADNAYNQRTLAVSEGNLAVNQQNANQQKVQINAAANFNNANADMVKQTTEFDAQDRQSKKNAALLRPLIGSVFNVSDPNKPRVFTPEEQFQNGTLRHLIPAARQLGMLGDLEGVRFLPSSIRQSGQGDGFEILGRDADNNEQFYSFSTRDIEFATNEIAQRFSRNVDVLGVNPTTERPEFFTAQAAADLARSSGIGDTTLAPIPQQTQRQETGGATSVAQQPPRQTRRQQGAPSFFSEFKQTKADELKSEIRSLKWAKKMQDGRVPEANGTIGPRIHSLATQLEGIELGFSDEQLKQEAFKSVKGQRIEHLNERINDTTRMINSSFVSDEATRDNLLNIQQDLESQLSKLQNGEEDTLIMEDITGDRNRVGFGGREQRGYAEKLKKLREGDLSIDSNAIVENFSKPQTPEAEKRADKVIAMANNGSKTTADDRYKAAMSKLNSGQIGLLEAGIFAKNGTFNPQTVTVKGKKGNLKPVADTLNQQVDPKKVNDSYTANRTAILDFTRILNPYAAENEIEDLATKQTGPFMEFLPVFQQWTGSQQVETQHLHEIAEAKKFADLVEERSQGWVSGWGIDDITHAPIALGLAGRMSNYSAYEDDHLKVIERAFDIAQKKPGTTITSIVASYVKQEGENMRLRSQGHRIPAYTLENFLNDLEKE